MRRMAVEHAEEMSLIKTSSRGNISLNSLQALNFFDIVIKTAGKWFVLHAEGNSGAG